MLDIYARTFRIATLLDRADDEAEPRAAQDRLRGNNSRFQRAMLGQALAWWRRR